MIGELIGLLGFAGVVAVQEQTRLPEDQAGVGVARGGGGGDIGIREQGLRGAAPVVEGLRGAFGGQGAGDIGGTEFGDGAEGGGPGIQGYKREGSFQGEGEIGLFL